MYSQKVVAPQPLRLNTSNVAAINGACNSNGFSPVHTPVHTPIATLYSRVRHAGNESVMSNLSLSNLSTSNLNSTTPSYSNEPIFTQQFVSLLLETFNIAISDPSVTPIDPSRAPPPRILSRAASASIQLATSRNVQIYLNNPEEFFISNNDLIKAAHKRLAQELKNDKQQLMNQSSTNLCNNPLLPDNAITPSLPGFPFPLQPPNINFQQPGLARSNSNLGFGSRLGLNFAPL
ncbi:hypothetical protein TBLA_0G02720 [Henningerozyma blattae CBS 6284]|uniref:Uncharacterized protein n=1 Tax=Henningerozyma blattae (strain ATCC 34711 / CBS 6284 / DSM 70876 / NBRC 10599 / NRRL Y-10934 / UCD 77-7) TaxID=1071380 RepID=I2H758_HENB6|nr:hypothetical protein TBLA_0G02720 [Tetrapisispora blattae CBS 6284]CCH62210.1 hypothetical protein TBLA_0G02720 [Tetrapisispora blattae CBS 6284]